MLVALSREDEAPLLATMSRALSRTLVSSVKGTGTKQLRPTVAAVCCFRSAVAPSRNLAVAAAIWCWAEEDRLCVHGWGGGCY